MGLNQVFVTNTNDEPHEDKYDGEDFVFPPHEPVLIPVDAAVHMLGYGLADKTDTLLRLGKATKVDPAKGQLVDNPDGVRWLANFVFDEAVVQPKTALAQAVDDLAPA
jgi:hypothetical protein